MFFYYSFYDNLQLFKPTVKMKPAYILGSVKVQATFAVWKQQQQQQQQLTHNSVMHGALAMKNNVMQMCTLFDTH